MGTRVAPSYAIIFSGRLGCSILSTTNKQPLVRWRCIDDIFMLWAHGAKALNDFLETLNQYPSTIKFTASWSLTEVFFWNTRVFVEDNRFTHQTD